MMYKERQKLKNAEGTQGEIDRTNQAESKSAKRRLGGRWGSLKIREDRGKMAKSV